MTEQLDINFLVGLFSLMASCASIVLAVVAIGISMWMSFRFNSESSNVSNEMRDLLAFLAALSQAHSVASRRAS